MGSSYAFSDRVKMLGREKFQVPVSSGVPEEPHHEGTEAHLGTFGIMSHC